MLQLGEGEDAELHFIQVDIVPNTVMSNKQRIDLSFEPKFDKKAYTPGSTIIFQPKIWNNLKKKIRITKYHLWFDWLKNKNEEEECSCNVDAVISPGKSKIIKEKLTLRVPIWLEPSHHEWKIKVDADLKSNGEWETIRTSQSTKPDKVLIEKSPQKNYMIFISHKICESDKILVDRIIRILKNNGFTPYVIEKNPQENPNLWDEIDEKILTMNCFLLLWTKKASKRSGELREELGKAKLLQKLGGKFPIFCLSETSNIPSSLSGIKYTKLNRNSMNRCIQEIVESISIDQKNRKSRKKNRK